MRLTMLTGDNQAPHVVRTWKFELNLDDIDLPITDREKALMDRIRAEIESLPHKAPISLQLFELAVHAIAVERALGPGEIGAPPPHPKVGHVGLGRLAEPVRPRSIGSRPLAADDGAVKEIPAPDDRYVPPAIR